MVFIIFLLNNPAAPGFLNGSLHGVCNGICIHNYPPFGIAGSPSYRLNQRRGGAKEALLICIQYGYQRDFRYIQTFSEKIDSHQYIENIQTHIPDNLRPFQSINIRMQIFNPDTYLLHIIRQILSHPFGQSSNQNFVVLFHFLIDFRDQIINLPLYRPHIYFRIEESGRANNLLSAKQLVICLIFRRSGRNE